MSRRPLRVIPSVAMNEQPRWLVEVRWLLSAVFSLLAVLVVCLIIAEVWDSSFTTQAADQAKDVVGSDRLAGILTAGLLLPLYFLVWPFWFVLAGILGFRLLVPTFAGIPPRLVGVVCCTWGLGLGALNIFPDPLARVFLVLVAVLWGLLTPFPVKSLLAYGPWIGGAVIGLGFAALAQQGVLPVAALWCAWRLYKKRGEEVVATGFMAAFLPGLLVLRHLDQVTDSAATAMIALMVVVLVAEAAAGGWTAVIARQRKRDQREPAAASQT